MLMKDVPSLGWVKRDILNLTDLVVSIYIFLSSLSNTYCTPTPLPYNASTSACINKESMLYFWKKLLENVDFIRLNGRAQTRYKAGGFQKFAGRGEKGAEK